MRPASQMAATQQLLKRCSCSLGLFDGLGFNGDRGAARARDHIMMASVSKRLLPAPPRQSARGPGRRGRGAKWKAHTPEATRKAHSAAQLLVAGPWRAIPDSVMAFGRLFGLSASVRSVPGMAKCCPGPRCSDAGGEQQGCLAAGPAGKVQRRGLHCCPLPMLASVPGPAGVGLLLLPPAPVGGCPFLLRPALTPDASGRQKGLQASIYRSQLLEQGADTA